MISTGRIGIFLSIFITCVSGIVHEDKKTDGGRFRYTYDETVSSNCQSVLMIGVGTAMRNSDYDIIASKISTGEPIITIFTDPKPFNFVKTSEKAYAKLYNSITQNLGGLVSVCEGLSPKIIIGGHSASGQAAFGALSSSLLEQKPDGFLGLDPFRVNTKRVWFPRPGKKTDVDPSLPLMSWGFDKKTCFVSINSAAKAAYEIAGEENRVFYRLDNKLKENRNIKHCEFTDSGCIPFICGTSGRTDIKDAFAKSIQSFVGAVQKGLVQASYFAVSAVASPDVDVEVFVNAQVPN